MNCIGAHCDINGHDLPDGAPPPSSNHSKPGDQNPWHPFSDRAQFELADFLFCRNEMPRAQKIDQIDDSKSWQSFSFSYAGNDLELENGNLASWKQETYQLVLRNAKSLIQEQLACSEFKDYMDYCPRQIFDDDGNRVWSDFMSGNWAWEQCNILSKDEENHGAMFVPVILGSDKTTVSVATGNVEYWPLYLTTGNVYNSARRSHGSAVSLLGFLAIPKTDQEFANDQEFRNFRRQLFHASLQVALEPLHDTMTKPEVTLCADGHYRRVIYGIGPYIADYPEQVLLSCIVQGWCAKCLADRKHLDESVPIPRNHDHTKLVMQYLNSTELWKKYGIVDGILPFTATFPRANIHELIAPDILHQIIKGTFKDHLVKWVEIYIREHYQNADSIMADIDRRIAAVPSFPGLRRFPQGRGFKQWTGNDSKALMKVYLPAIADYIPTQMVQAIAAFMEFCYIVRQYSLTEHDLKSLNSALQRFETHRSIFQTCGIRPSGISIPRIHALQHYEELIQLFGAPNGLCSSITESKHIKAVKKPYRRSNRNNALNQILITNQQLENLISYRNAHVAEGLLNTPLISIEQDSQSSEDYEEPGYRDDSHINEANEVEENDIDAWVELAKVPNPRRLQTFEEMGYQVHCPKLSYLVAQFIYETQHPNGDLDGIPDVYPPIITRGYSYSSAVATFFAPSEHCGIKGFHRQHIYASLSWRDTKAARFDCVFISKDPDLPGIHGLYIAQVLLFFSFIHHSIKYSCALVRWFNVIGNHPCPKTGMWMVEPEFDIDGERLVSVISIDSILHPAHLIPVYGNNTIPRDFKYTDSLFAFSSYYVNRFSDYHAYQLLS
ncbi:hypothetical protein L210DRAFT_3614931 [Boletus edulis BED1]|uniref:Uncharacterized protein n=1 Tax=Boletus edulis BED1 TaxID=1328754 RepID=A0AAD4BFN4_BOLED|nr:hypothetical protein L210DRAFT_3614931 [Boletus edulis BED1]